MKRLFLSLCLTIAGATAALATEIDDLCGNAADAILAGDLYNAEDMANEAYADKADCSAANLADLAIIYYRLTEKSADAVSRYDFAMKTIDCYKSATDKDAAAASKRFAEKGVSMDAIAKKYSANIDSFVKDVAAEMDF